jgi:hypothetical protein
MKSLIITEIEKKSILHNYTSNNSSSSTLNEELNKIGNLMGITPKLNLVSEESIITKGIFDLPMFKEYNKYLKNIGSEGAEELLQKDISELSPRLRQDGITNDNLAAKARDYWSKQSLKGETQLKGQDDVDLVDWFLKEKYADEIFDINTRVLRTLEEKQNSTLKSISTGLDLRLPNGTNPKFKENFTADVTIDDINLNKTDVDNSIDDLIEGEKFCDDKIKKLKDQKEVAKSQGNTNLLNDLNTKIRQWEDLKTTLTEKKQLYENWKVNYDTIYNKIPKTKIKIAGVEYDMTKLTPFQKFILTNTVTKQFQFILTIFKMAEIAKLGSKVGVLEESIAGLRNAIGQPPNSMNFKDIDAYTQKVVTTIKAFTGRPVDIGKKLSIFDALNPLSSARTTFSEEWNKFLNMLDASDLTDVEKEQIKKTLLERFSSPKTSEKYQWTVFYDDIKTVLGRLGTDENGVALQSELKKSLEEKTLFEQSVIYVKYFKEILLGKTWKEFIPFFIQTFTRLGFTGLLTGMRTAVAPLLKYGINPKGLLRTFFRLYLIKSTFSVAAATLIFGGKWLIYGLAEGLQLYPDLTKKTYEEWANETWNNYMDDIQDTFSTWPLSDFSFGEQDELVKTTGPFGGDIQYRKYKYSEGIFRQYAAEWFMEWISATRNAKSDEDVDIQQLEDLKEWQKETKTKWVDNAIEGAGPENTKTYLNVKTNLPVYQNTILDLLKDSTISSHLYYRFDFSTETPSGFDTQKGVTGKFDDFTPSLSNVMGQVRICETLPINLSNGTQKCKGNSWRVDAFNPYGTTSTLNRDENFDKFYVMAKSGVGSGPLFDKAKKMKEQEIVYITNPDEGQKSYPSIGIDMVNVEPIENIKSKLK